MHPQDCEKLKSQEKDSLYLQIHQELHFPFELRNQLSLRLSNKSANYVAFKVKGNARIGVVLPRSTCDILVTMQAQKEAPPDMLCEDKLLIQSIVARPRVTTKDITSEMFHKGSGYVVDECKLRVVYVAPPKSLALVREGSYEDSFPQASVFSEGRELISKLTKERNSAIEQNKRLRQELKLLRREEECIIM